MNYQESIEYSLRVRWKAVPCVQSGEKCWCRVIKPEQEIVDEDGNEIYICGSGEISKEHAEHIVKAHNAFLEKEMKEK